MIVWGSRRKSEGQAGDLAPSARGPPEGRSAAPWYLYYTPNCAGLQEVKGGWGMRHRRRKVTVWTVLLTIIIYPLWWLMFCGLMYGFMRLCVALGFGSMPR